MDRIVTRLWTVTGAALSVVVVAAVLTVLGLWTFGVITQDEDLAFHGGASLMFLALYLPWFATHYWVRPTLVALLLPLVAVFCAPGLFLLLLLVTMETPGATVHVQTALVVTILVAPVAGSCWFVARCRRRWARLLARTDATPGGRVAELVEVVQFPDRTRVRLVDVRTGERQEGTLWGRFSRRDLCVLDGSLRVVDRVAPIVRSLGRVRPIPATHYVTAPTDVSERA